LEGQGLGASLSSDSERFEYVLANGVKEGLVARVCDWPGVQCVRALLDGEKLKGYFGSIGPRSTPPESISLIA
jgi:hypothetical protein